jgi:hypothetical protein
MTLRDVAAIKHFLTLASFNLSKSIGPCNLIEALTRCRYVMPVMPVCVRGYASYNQKHYYLRISATNGTGLKYYDRLHQ